MDRIEVLQWEKISLVVPERSDARIWQKWMNHLETQMYIGFFWKIFYLEDEEEFYEDIRKNKKDRTFCIFSREKRQIIGNISLFGISERHRNATLGVAIFDDNNQNKWFWTEAVQLMLKYGFENLGLYKVKLEVQSRNFRAIRVYEKCGFQVSGILKNEIFDGEKFSDMTCMEIFRDDFLSKKQ